MKSPDKIPPTQEVELQAGRVLNFGPFGRVSINLPRDDANRYTMPPHLGDALARDLAELWNRRAVALIEEEGERRNDERERRERELDQHYAGL